MYLRCGLVLIDRQCSNSPASPLVFGKLVRRKDFGLLLTAANKTVAARQEEVTGLIKAVSCCKDVQP
jgi:hypothetical protein